MNITVIGSGYVGTTTAAVLAVSGYKVTAIDLDKTKVDKINKSKAPFYEPGLDNLLAKAVKSKTLRATQEYKKPISDSQIVFSCVGTPDNPDGSSNLSYVYSAASEAIKYMKPGSVYVQKSTVPVGTGAKISKLFKEKGAKNIDYVSNPEFLRESTAIQDTIIFDRVVAGGPSSATKTVLDVYRIVEKNARIISQLAELELDDKLFSAQTGEYISTSLESAELTKVASNAFLAMKISF